MLKSLCEGKRMDVLQERLSLGRSFKNVVAETPASNARVWKCRFWVLIQLCRNCFSVVK